ncbi:MAG TPA: chromate resistance protein ChrB domain-containing protein [Burkholderiales bacterium]|nr:chromate resistance protein ChrB domain-containing protein [Burkholderiales bacterium]
MSNGIIARSPLVLVAELQSAILESRPPLVIDVRAHASFQGATELIGGALWRDPERVSEWASELPRASRVVVYCTHGGEVSQGVARALRESGLAAQYLQGGIEDWKAARGELDRKPALANTRWVTRERPKIDRIACPWLLARFVDPEAEFLYVPTKDVLDTAKGRDAIPYDVPDVRFTHEGERCSFDALLRHFHLCDPALGQLATIVRGADTARLDLAPQASGLAAISVGLSRKYADDHEMLKHGMVMYDALYAWCKGGQDEVHTWNPAAYR